MAEDREVVRERVRRYRLKKSGGVPKDPVYVVHPVVMAMFYRLEKRLERVEQLYRGRVEAAGVGEDLVSRVMKNRGPRIRG